MDLCVVGVSFCVTLDLPLFVVVLADVVNNVQESLSV